MDERPDQIIGHIEAQRDQLGRNLNELETRVRQSTDWRTYYDRNPMLMMGAALGGGLLLGSMVGSKSRSSGFYPKSRSRSSYSSSAMGLSSAGVGAAAGSAWSQPSSSSGYRPQSSHATSQQWNQVSQTMEHIKGALIAFGMAKAKEFLGQAIPGIDQHLSEAEKKHQSQGHSDTGHQGSKSQSERFADSGAFTQGSGGNQSTNWESDMYRSSGQSGHEGSSHQSGNQSNEGQSNAGDYYSGTRSGDASGDAAHKHDPVPTHQY